jgi:hypothetical protein
VFLLSSDEVTDVRLPSRSFQPDAFHESVVLAAFTLAPASAYRFRVSVSSRVSGAVLAVDSVDIVTATTPTVGTVTVSPTSGMATVTRYVSLHRVA